MLSLLVAHFRLGRLRFQVQVSAWGGLVRAALPIALLQVFFSLSLRADTFLLKHYQGDAPVGWYSAAYDIVFGLFILAQGINTAFFPTVSRIAQGEPERARALSQGSAHFS